MKYLFVIVLLIPFAVSGQPGKPSGKQRKDSFQNKPFRENPQVIVPGEMPFEDFDILTVPGSELPQMCIKRKPEAIIDSIASKRFPGSGKFYARRSDLVRQYDKSFIIWPRIDSLNKYYMIIKDPITQRITK